ncbi:MAG: glycine cleavage system protein GcvH [Beutenbergiaceae bacterium]
MSNVADDRRYSTEHEWIAPHAGSHARIGVSHVAADALGDIVYLDLPQPGQAITAGEVCGEIESTKSVSELYAPVTGVVTEINDDAVANPELVNEDPYGTGWLFIVDVTAEGPLLDAAEYAAQNGLQG